MFYFYMQIEVNMMADLSKKRTKKKTNKLKFQKLKKES